MRKLTFPKKKKGNLALCLRSFYFGGGGPPGFFTPVVSYAPRLISRGKIPMQVMSYYLEQVRNFQ